MWCPTTRLHHARHVTNTQCPQKNTKIGSGKLESQIAPASATAPCPPPPGRRRHPRPMDASGRSCSTTTRPESTSTNTRRATPLGFAVAAVRRRSASSVAASQHLACDARRPSGGGDSSEIVRRGRTSRTAGRGVRSTNTVNGSDGNPPAAAVSPRSRAPVAPSAAAARPAPLLLLHRGIPGGGVPGPEPPAPSRPALPAAGPFLQGDFSEIKNLRPSR